MHHLINQACIPSITITIDAITLQCQSKKYKSSLEIIYECQVKYPGSNQSQVGEELASNSNRSALENLDRNIKLSTVFCAELHVSSQ